jgi:flagellar assembly factor FliW
MQIATSRFGVVSFEESDVLKFPEGILGFTNLRQFVLLDDPTDDIFVWLQSCETPEIAFPVLEPELFSQNYKITLTRVEMETLGANNLEGLRLFSIITIPDDPTKMTANLKAPIVINVQKRLARQCVLQDIHYAVREPIFMALQQRVYAKPEISIKQAQKFSDVSVRIKQPNLSL